MDHLRTLVMGVVMHKRFVLIYSLLVATLWPNLAHAYLDPGTGSILLQAILGAIGAGYLFFKTSWYRVKAFFGSATPEEKAALNVKATNPSQEPDN